MKNQSEIEKYLTKKYNKVELIKLADEVPDKKGMEEDVSKLDRHFDATYLRDISMIQGGVHNQITMDISNFEVALRS